MEYGTYMIVGADTTILLTGGPWRGFGLSLEEVQVHLDQAEADGAAT